ncbi:MULTISPECIES: ATP-binding protein [Brachymonas]|uniref:ATP-binding protein n=1 Tax=Brachymonas TaxID=28219 RepID=UPI002E7A5838|nr:ATP-binding protein [Brachymonas sp. J145]MEE1652392.1 ATP-binding protein [Brachymonas sp. J145]
MNLSNLPSRHSLSTKLIVLSVLWLVVATVSIGYTLVLSWQLQGGGAAINDAGSLRMRSYHMLVMLSQQQPREVIEADQRIFEQTLNTLIDGDPARPLMLPDTPEIQSLAQVIKRQWQVDMLPLLEPVGARQIGLATLNAEVDRFVANINQLVRLIEQHNAQNTAMLRMFQFLLIGMAFIGALTMIYMLYLMVILPVSQLHDATLRLSQGSLDSRVELDSQDEFGVLATGFNTMAEHLQELLQDMEHKVQEKTRELEDNNLQLRTLYAVTTLLNQKQELEQASNGFLEQVMRLTGAEAGFVRLLDPDRDMMDVVAQIGVPDGLLHQSDCKHTSGCYCGRSLQAVQPITLHTSTERVLQDNGERLHCARAGFESFAIFHVRTNRQDLGIYTLFFRQEHNLTDDEHKLLEALGSHLGVTINNIRLAARDRQLAVMEERNLMAQGLHDSIAQSLSFLNLQVQMLESALAHGEQEQVQENLAFIRSGVQESYEDVRELLLNFRVRISKQELPEAVRTLLQRFELQTHVATHLELGGDGLPLSPQEQLQLIFILQEALSNVRKHAQASHVDVRIRNDADLVMTVTDNGRGIDLAEMESRQSRHVGMSIMEERARRIHASIRFDHMPQGGTRVTLHLPEKERNAT